MRKLISEQGSVDKQYAIFAGKWRRYHGLGIFSHLIDIKTMLKNIRDAFLFGIGIIQSFFILILWRPDVVFVKGGYVGLPVGLVAAFLRIPIVTHDSDSVPGLTNRILSRYAKLQAVGLPIDLYSKFYDKSKLRFTGVPVQQQFYNIDEQTIIAAKKYFGFKTESKIVSIVGGSLGAVRLNESVFSNLKKLLDNESINILWVTGAYQYEKLKVLVDKLGIDHNRLKMFAFSSNMLQIIAASDIVISRAGATSIAELAAAAKPTILVPNPYLTGGHQTKNAQSLFESQAVYLITEHELSAKPEILRDQIFELLADSDQCKRISQNLSNLTVPDATDKIVSTIEEAIN